MYMYMYIKLLLVSRGELEEGIFNTEGGNADWVNHKLPRVGQEIKKG